MTVFSKVPGKLLTIGNPSSDVINCLATLSESMFFNIILSSESVKSEAPLLILFNKSFPTFLAPSLVKKFIKSSLFFNKKVIIGADSLIGDGFRPIIERILLIFS